MRARLTLTAATLLALHTPLLAGEQVVVLTSHEALTEALVERLPDDLQRIGDAIGVDEEAKRWTTDEGTQIPFGELFKGGKSFKGPALTALQREYRSGLVALCWVSKDEVKEFKAYDLKKRSVEVEVRLVVTATGKVLFSKTLKHKGKFAADEDADEALTATVETWPVDKAKKALAKALEGYQPGDAVGRVKLLVRRLTQKEYFEHRGRYLGLARLAGGKGRVWDEYDRASETMTVRLQRASEFDTYYRNLYHAVLVEEGLTETFDLETPGDGSTIVLTRLPAEQRRLVILGLTAEQYHDRLAVYRDAVAAMDGAGDVKADFLAATGHSEAALVVRFTFRGDLVPFEETLWKGLKASGKVPNRELVSITQGAILYRAGLGAGEARGLTVHVRCLSPDTYKDLAKGLDAAIASLAPQDLEREYFPHMQRLTFRFKAPLTPAAAEDGIWKHLRKDPTVAHLAPDATRGSTIGLVYLQPKPTHRALSIELQALPPEHYKDLGRTFVSLISTIAEVRKVTHDYSEANRTLRVDLEYDGETIHAVDSALWPKVAQVNGFEGLALGSLSATRAVYFFKGSDAAAGAEPGVVVVLKNLGPQVQKFVSTDMIAILSRVPGARAVRGEYSVNARAGIYRLQFEGEVGAFATQLEAKLTSNPRFAHVAKGVSLGNRLEYYYHEQDLTDPEVVGSSSGAPPAAVGGSVAGLVEHLDPSVVVVFYRDARASGHGTGFFVNKRGYVLTNAHVVPGGQLSIQTYDGRRYRAQLVKKDEQLDLALLKVVNPRTDWPAVQIGDSSGLKRGQQVLVIGTPLREEYDHSVSTGIVAGRNRHRGLLQITVPTYPGNSGSPLFDTSGRAVGVVVSVAMARKRQLVVDGGGQVRESEAHEAVENIGFAIPIQFAKPLLSLAE